MPTPDRLRLQLRRRRLLRALALIIGIGIALAAAPFLPRVLRACGPYFALEILPSRQKEVMNAPPADAVADGLVPKPGDHLPLGEFGENDEVRTRAEAKGLPEPAADQIKGLRALNDGDAAYAAGEGLPEAVRAYTAGAVCYHQHQFDKAQQYFERVLALKPGDGAREQRAVWASFMLGTVARLNADNAAAATHWATTRGLVRSGLPDPLGLAIASFGEEARLFLQPGMLAKAVALYARQAAYGSESGAASLFEVAKQTLADPNLLEEGIGDATTRRLLLRYLYARGVDEKPERVQLVAEAFDRHRVSDADGADLLAASAYAAGQFDLAARMVGYQQTPLAWWITGKLALRRGDRLAALTAFADAVKGLPAHQSARGRVQAEAGVLRASAGEFAQAIELFYGAVVDSWAKRRSATDYWNDLAYLSERVLTIDELLPIVDRIAPTPSRAALAAAREREQELPAAKLRALAARRLMRAGRYREALRYFDADDHLHNSADEYIKALSKGASPWRSRGARAESWFEAATIARHDGMELLGFELDPDYAVYEGEYDLGPHPPASERPSAAGTAHDQNTPPTPAAAAIVGVSADERARATASASPIAERFQYRRTAVDHALASAALVPRSSQAFAAILCHATAWVIDREPQRAAEIYARYVREGPIVAWATHFGRDCPEPDFAAAEHRRWQERLVAITWIVNRHPRRLAAAGAAIVTAGAAWIVWRRLRRRPAPMTS